MVTLENIIKGKLGDRIHQKDLTEIAQIAVDNENGVIDTLLHLVFEENDDLGLKKLSDNATWAIQHLKKKDLITHVYPLRDQLIDLALNTQSTSKQRMLLAILRDTEFKETNLRTDFIDFCLSTMSSCESPVGIRSLCIHLAYMQCKHYPELMKELKEQLELMEDDLLQPGLRSAKVNTLKFIEKTLQKTSKR